MDIDKELANLDGEEKRLKARCKRLEKSYSEARKMLRQIADERHRLNLMNHIGQKVHVIRGVKDPGDQHYDENGTLLAVKRTRCLVSFVNGEWRYPIEYIVPGIVTPG